MVVFFGNTTQNYNLIYYITVHLNCIFAQCLTDKLPSDVIHLFLWIKSVEAGYIFQVCITC